jgi:hypothetical protein
MLYPAENKRTASSNTSVPTPLLLYCGNHLSGNAFAIWIDKPVFYMPNESPDIVRGNCGTLVA